MLPPSPTTTLPPAGFGALPPSALQDPSLAAAAQTPDQASLQAALGFANQLVNGGPDLAVAPAAQGVEVAQAAVAAPARQTMLNGVRHAASQTGRAVCDCLDATGECLYTCCQSCGKCAYYICLCQCLTDCD